MRKPVRLTQQPIITSTHARTIQLKNISLKDLKPYRTTVALANTILLMLIKDRMKQPIANDKNTLYCTYNN